MSAGKVALGLVKWIVVPAGFLAIGYQFIGPTIGARPPKEIQKLGQRIGMEIPKESEGGATVPEAKEPVPSYPEPKVSLRVTKRSGTPSEEQRQNRDEPSADEPPAEPPTEDPPAEGDLPVGVEGNL